jgi:serine protease
MKRFLILLTALVAFPPAVSAAETARYLVATRGPARTARIAITREGIDLDASSAGTRAFENVPAFAATLTAEQAEALRRSLRVAYVEPVLERHLLEVSAPRRTPSTTHSTQFHPPGIDLLHAPEVWPFAGAVRTNVVIIDTGIDATHPDLAASYAGGYNTFDPSSDPRDDNGHGTHVAGIIAAADNDFGVVGVAPTARIWSVKVLDQSGSGSTEHIVTAVDWAISQKATLGGQWVLSLSLGSSGSSLTESAAFSRALDAGMLTFAASGNEGPSVPIDFPAGYPTVNAVGAIDSTLKIASFSNQGHEMAFVAPGVNVDSTAAHGFGPVFGQFGVDGTITPAMVLYGSPLGTITGTFVDCGYGRIGDFPATAAGNIALVRRGPVSAPIDFSDKARNAKAAGATAVIVMNHDGDFSLQSPWVLIRTDFNCLAPGFGCKPRPDDLTFDFPLTIGVTKPDGEALLLKASTVVSATVGTEDYDLKSGTSMSTPHASGAAALLWSLAPSATAAQVREALISGAHDLGAKGFDTVFGYGLIDILASAKVLAPAALMTPVSDAPHSNRKARSVRH